MTSTDSALGACPQCGHEIPSAYLLIEYETETNETGIWAECPACEDVIAPTDYETP